METNTPLHAGSGAERRLPHHEVYSRRFADRDAAVDWMRDMNRTSRTEIFCVVDGPEDDYAVVDLRTAIELGGRYEWSVR